MTYEETYRLGSAELIHAPSVVRWAINGYRFPKDRKILVRLLVEGWNIPNIAAIALLSGASPFVVEDGDFVVFQSPGEDELMRPLKDFVIGGVVGVVIVVAGIMIADYLTKRLEAREASDRKAKCIARLYDPGVPDPHGVYALAAHVACEED